MRLAAGETEALSVFFLLKSIPILGPSGAKSMSW
jgi:hypothetical protein